LQKFSPPSGKTAEVNNVGRKLVRIVADPLRSANNPKNEQIWTKIRRRIGQRRIRDPTEMNPPASRLTFWGRVNCKFTEA
jgi:hypothetical protein